MTRSPAADAELPSHIVLIGFMGSGKSTSGPLIARMLGYDFVDLDQEVEERAGRSVADIFQIDGESSFRMFEAAATRELADRSRIVIAAGGGWIVGPGAEQALPSALLVWLKARPDTLLARLSGQQDTRPLLDSADPLGSIRRLLEDRESYYARAEVQIETDDLTPDDVATEVVRQITAGRSSEAISPG